MTKGRSLLLAPALLGAFWMARSRGGRSLFNMRRHGRSQGGLQSLMHGIMGRRSGLMRLFR